MKLQSINVQNYRTLHDIHLSFARNYCAISGANNAGKSSLIRLLLALFPVDRPMWWARDDTSFVYKQDKTQWDKTSNPIRVAYNINVSKTDDPALISFIETHTKRTFPAEDLELCITYTITEDDSFFLTIDIAGERADDNAAKEIHRRIRDANLLLLHNSTTHLDEFFLAHGRAFYEFNLSPEDKKALADAEKHVEQRLRKLAKEHTRGLTDIIGRLADKYDVQIVPADRYVARQLSLLGISLGDKNVQAPLNDWGSGTQNRTQILMTILHAKRIKESVSPDEKITPIVVIEEPESFLHPSAQAEFGRLLRDLSKELDIQIITTTHSPYMLNVESPGSNILLRRRIKRRKMYETERVDTSGDKWMAPFADHLGTRLDEFSDLRQLFESYKRQVLLVEGPLDREYFMFMQQHPFSCARLNPHIEIVPYGGKDTLKNTVLLQFVLRQFDRVFVTFDLDAKDDVQSSLNRLGLQPNKDYLPLGINQPGKQCIEGLLPQSVLSAVHHREPDLVMRLSSANSNERKSAKSELKRKYLQEFRARQDLGAGELSELNRVIERINSQLKGR